MDKATLEQLEKNRKAYLASYTTASSLTGQDLVSSMRGATAIVPIDFNKVAELSPNVAGTSGLREGMIFKIVTFLNITSTIQGNSSDRLGVRIEDVNGEQRTIYAAAMMRKLPTKADNDSRLSVEDHAPENVMNFDLGILAPFAGESDNIRALALIGDGTQFIKVGGSIQDKFHRKFVNPSALANRTNSAGEPAKVGDTFEIVNTFHNLEWANQAEIDSAKA